MTIQNIVEFAKCDTPEIAKEMLEFISDFDGTFPKVMSRLLWIDCAFESVFGYLLNKGCYEWELFYDSCGNNCTDKEERKAIIGEEYFVGEKRLKCYECDQLFFINIIDKISKGLEYSEIKEFNSLLRDTIKTVRWSVDIVDNIPHSPFKDQLAEGLYIVPDGFFELIENPFMADEDTQKLFKCFIYSAIGYSLISFLIKNDRRKLKRCPYCNNFFIAKSINRKTRCYESDCEKAYQRVKKRKQREKEPDIYY